MDEAHLFLVPLFEAFLCNDSAIIKNAEEHYTQLKSKDPRSTVSALVNAVRFAVKSEHRMLAAVMLRSITIRQRALWNAFSEEEIRILRSVLAAALMTESARPVQRAVVNLVAAHAALGDWPELMHGLIDLSRSSETVHVQLSLFLIEKLAEHIGPLLVNNLNVILSIVCPCLDKSHPLLLRNAAGLALISLMFEVVAPSAALLDTFAEVVILLGDLLGAKEESMLQDLIGSLSKLAKEHGKVLSGHTSQLLPILVNGVHCTELEENTRIMCVELLLELFSSSEIKSSCSTPQTRSQLLKMFVQLMSTQGSDDDHADSSEFVHRPDENFGFGDIDGGMGESLEEFASTCLDQFVQQALPEEVLSTCLPLASQLLQQESNWHARRAAYVVVSIVSSGAHDELERHLELMVQTCLRGTHDAESRVRYAAIYCLTVLIDEYSATLHNEDSEDDEDDDMGSNAEEDTEGNPPSEGFQAKFHAIVVPNLCQVIEANSAFPRVVFMALGALKSFFNPDKCLSLYCQPYSLGILQFCNAALLQSASGNTIVLEEIASVLGNVALLTASDELLPRYESIVAPLKVIIGASPPPHANYYNFEMLKAKCLECFALVGKAVGVERYLEDALVILSYLANCHDAGLDFSDPLSSYMIQTGARIAGTVGPEHFHPFVSKFLPPLIARIGEPLSISVSREDLDNTTNSTGNSGEPFEARDGDKTCKTYERGVGVVSITCNTHQVIEKETACRVLFQYCMDIPALVWSYAPAALEAVVPNIASMYITEDLTVVTTSLVNELIKLHLSYCSVDESSTTVANSMIDSCVSNYITSLERLQLAKSIDLNVTLTVLDGLREVLKLIWESNNVIQRVPCMLREDLMSPLLIVLRDGVVIGIQRHSLASSDSEERRDDAEEVDSSIWDNLMDCLGWTIKLYGSKIDSSFTTELFPLLMGLLSSFGEQNNNSDGTSSLLVLSLGLLIDALEYIPNSNCSSSSVGLLANALFQNLIQPDLSVCCAYGLGVCAMHGGAAFDGAANVAVSTLREAMNSADSICGNDDTLAATLTDNICSSLFKIYIFRGGELPVSVREEVLAIVLERLPLRADLFEARCIHKLFIDLLSSNDTRLVDPVCLNQVMDVLVKLTMFASIVEVEKCAGNFDFWNEQIVTPGTLQKATTILVNWLQCSSFSRTSPLQRVFATDVIDSVIFHLAPEAQSFLKSFGMKHQL